MKRRTLIGGAGVAGITGMGVYQWRNGPLPAPSRPNPENWKDGGIHAAWLGHTTVLLRMDGYTILTDPVLGNRIGPDLGLFTLGPERIVAPALRIKQLPKIDLVLLSHAHFDHLDRATLRGLESRGTEVVTATRTSDLLHPTRWSKVREMGWGDRATAGPVELRAFEVNHWGARMQSDRYRGYNGYVLKAGRYRVLFGGDTAVTTGFRAVRESRPFDLAIMPVGAYNPWIHYHCTPEQAWQMAGDAGAEFFLPVHHQTFRLSREPFREPIERVFGAAGNHPDRVAVDRIGREFHMA
jgi:L-ascorbate metabolism protein UlaG (beta-lactamase superfamily)